VAGSASKSVVYDKEEEKERREDVSETSSIVGE
jgi:hypothetical protein